MDGEVLRVAEGLAVAVSLTACTQQPPRIAVAQKWNDAIQRYNLVPIYPMQEDVQIGDVFLYLPAANGSFDSQPTTWLNRLGSPNFVDVLNALNSDYCHRFRMAEEPVVAASTAAATNAKTDASKAGTTPDTTSATLPTATPVTLKSSTSLPGVATTTLEISVPPAAKPTNKTLQNTTSKTPPLDYRTRCLKFDDPTAWNEEQAKEAAAAKAAHKLAKPASAADSSTAMTPAAYPPDIDKAGASADLRLRRVELPGIAVASVTDAELAAAIPVSAFLGKIGLGASSNVGLDISLSGIEEVHLPFNAELMLFEKEKVPFVTQTFPPATLLAYLGQKRPDLLRSACFVDLAALNNSKMLILVANEVVYAHGIDYAYKSSSTFAGQLGASLAATSAAKTTSAATATGGTNVTTTVTTNTAAPASGAEKPVMPASTDPIQAAQTALTGESTELAGLTGSLSGPGGSLQAGIGRSGNLTLSDKFSEPLAFGIGELLEWSPSDLLWLYRSTARSSGANAKTVADSARDGYTLYCNDTDRPMNRVSFSDFVTLPSKAELTDKNRVSFIAPTQNFLGQNETVDLSLVPLAPQVRFRPFEGLPK
jgi:hypothetical protein